MGFLLLSTLLCVVWVKIPYQRCPTVEWVAQRALVGFLIDREWRVHSILPLHSKTLAGETVTIVSRTKWNESVRFLTIPWKFSGSKGKGIYFHVKCNEFVVSLCLRPQSYKALQNVEPLSFLGRKGLTILEEMARSIILLDHLIIKCDLPSFFL